MNAAIATTGSTDRRIGRSIGAAVAGFLTVVVLSTVVDQIFHMLGVYPPWGQPMPDPGDNALALSYRIVITVFGGWVTAHLAPHRPMMHVLILASIGFVIGVAAAVATIPLHWGPAWYPILIPITGLPATWLGGWLYVSRRASESARGVDVA